MLMPTFPFWSQVLLWVCLAAILVADLIEARSGSKGKE